ncbi:MAG: molybdopterin-dependent oxidoreductase [Senegalimassilia anaerobia]
MNQGYDYSTAHMLQAVIPYMYGSASNIADPKTGLHKTLGKKATKFSPYDNVNASAFSAAEAHSDLVVMFGSSPAETRQGGAVSHYDYAHMREKTAAEDLRQHRPSYERFRPMGHPDQWLPIHPGTDAALVAGIAHYG